MSGSGSDSDDFEAMEARAEDEARAILTGRACEHAERVSGLLKYMRDNDVAGMRQFGEACDNIDAMRELYAAVNAVLLSVRRPFDIMWPQARSAAKHLLSRAWDGVHGWAT